MGYELRQVPAVACKQSALLAEFSFPNGFTGAGNPPADEAPPTEPPPNSEPPDVDAPGEAAPTPPLPGMQEIPPSISVGEAFQSLRGPVDLPVAAVESVLSLEGAIV